MERRETHLDVICGVDDSLDDFGACFSNDSFNGKLCLPYALSDSFLFHTLVLL